MRNFFFFPFLLVSCAFKSHTDLLFGFQGGTLESRVFDELQSQNLRWEVTENDVAYKSRGYMFKTIKIDKFPSLIGQGDLFISFFNEQLLSTSYCINNKTKQELLKLTSKSEDKKNTWIVGEENKLCLTLRDPIIDSNLEDWIKKNS